MYKFLTKNGQALAFGFGVLMVLIFLVTVNSGLDEFTPLDLAKDEARFDTGIFNFGLGVSMWLTRIAVFLALGFGLFHAARNPKGALKFIVGIVVLAIIFAIGYNMADGTVQEGWANFNVDEGISKMVGGAITTTGILLAVSVAVLFLGELRNFFK